MNQADEICCILGSVASSKLTTHTRVYRSHCIFVTYENNILTLLWRNSVYFSRFHFRIQGHIVPWSYSLLLFFFRLGSTNSLATPEVIMSSLMMTSSNGNIFRVTSYLCGEFTRHRWIPCTKASDRELWCFLWSPPEITVEQTIARLVIWDASSLWRHCNYIAGLIWLIHGGRDKMAAILGTTFSSSFSWMIIVVFWFIFHWNWFLRMQWTMC